MDVTQLEECLCTVHKVLGSLPGSTVVNTIGGKHNRIINSRSFRNHAVFFILLPWSLRGTLLHSKLSEHHVI